MIINTIIKILFYFISSIAKWILFIFGWEKLVIPKEKLDVFFDENFKGIFVISHTSYWDGIIFFLYKLAYPDIFHRSLIVVKPQIFDFLPAYLQNFLKNLGFIRASYYEEKNAGFVNSTVNLLSEKKSYFFFISPKGCRDAFPWRSGYYNTAKILNVPLVVCGLDYETKSLKFFDPIYPDYESDTKDDLEIKLKHQMGEIIPLHPERSEVNLRKFDENKVGVFQFYSILIFISIVIFILIFYFYFKISPFIIISMFKIFSSSIL
jgi:1-acyl-sn-glycerol-3-phosphate acyltransferase